VTAYQSDAHKHTSLASISRYAVSSSNTSSEYELVSTELEVLNSHHHRPQG
jgi:hypothetical protein